MNSSISNKRPILNGKSHTKPDSVRFAVASTFTCNPVGNGLKFWGDKFGYKVSVNFSPYDQVFQQLLDLDSTLNHPENDARILFIRLEDWIRNLYKPNEADIHTHILGNIRYLCDYVITSASFTKAPLFLIITRNSLHSQIRPDQQGEYEQLISNHLSDRSNIFVITSADIDRDYPVEVFYDHQRDQLGHIPFSDEYFTALATSAFRNVLAVKRKPYKVIVLDCDNTLWDGACGELGAKGIDLSDSYLNLQNVMLQQMRAGKVLCLCSKNVEEDVDSVFAKRTDMLLRKESIVAFKINWNPKSQNIRELAEELNLGLDSFIFVDDNPVECAEVRANCPEVLTLNLPKKPDDIIPFLNHTWAFDLVHSTEEDQKRTKLYQENMKRTSFQKGSASLREFIEGLNLEISVKNPSAEEISRVSQLTYRTNQFNFTTIRRSEDEIKDLLQKDGFECKVCRVKDRFGNYGLVGVMLYQKLPDSLILDSFMLSCRVLGRGVEHRMLKYLGEAAKSSGIETVQINFKKTEKNLPALNFLESIIKGFSGDVPFGRNKYFLPSQYLSELIYDPDKNLSVKPTVNGHKSRSTEIASEEPNNQIFEKIARELNSVFKINQSLHPENDDSITHEFFNQPKNTIHAVTSIWENILEIKGIGPDQHFFDVGGTSLKAVEVLSQLNERFKKNLTIVSLFEHSTIRSLAELVDGKPNENNEFNKILQRAGTRRDRFRRKN